jgi:hypothetical protein
MNDQKITRTTLFIAAVAATLLVAAIGLRALRPIAGSVSDPTLDALKSQRAELASFTRLALDQATEKRLAAESRLWTSDKIDAWKADLPEGWKVQDVGAIPTVFTSQHRFLLNHSAAAFKDWPGIVAFISALAERPALRIHSLAITAPPGAKRNFSQLQLLISFTTSKELKPIPGG